MKFAISALFSGSVMFAKMFPSDHAVLLLRSLGLTKASQGMQPKVEIWFFKVSTGHGTQGKS